MERYAVPARPADEQARLDALRATQLLDSQPEELFDRITRVACASLNVPISLVSLVDESRQWFKASCGLAAKETDRDISFCGHAILNDEAFIVENALDDGRFAGNPLVTGDPHIRFYAGMPIRAANRNIGTLCVIDTQPRALSADDLQLLATLARTVEDLIYVREAAMRSVNLLNTWSAQASARESREVQVLRNMVTRDLLTGLPTRQAIESALADHVPGWVRAGGHALLAVVDIDNLAAINERAGHGVGDRFLREMANRLRQLAQPGDTIARIGGDMFALLLGPFGEEAAGTARIAAIHRDLNRVLALDHGDLHGSVTTGYVLAGRDWPGPGALLNHAIEAVGAAKLRGHGMMRVFDRPPSRLNGRALEHELRAALRGNQLFMAYQAKIDARTGIPTGVEALVRWRHPQLGLVGPAEFIPVAEESAIIVQLGEWTLEQACRQASRWRQSGRDGPTVAVNISPRQFLHGDIATVVDDMLSRYGVPAAMLELELTESVAVHDLEGAIATMRRLKEIGVTLSIDDFGTGYSSLAWLKRLPVDKLKIDKAFVTDLAGSPAARAILRGIVGIAEDLGIGTIAEGVETEAQADVLKAAGCREMQGYLFGRPGPAESVFRH
ncbi:GGDEF and EAL domain-containing protein [Massilia sp. METH4]|uniref:putative bifunctional diguanylate cyclase/phosphodiesterase n=1 Tax=Massilia sp. METH4 TaxID=3123041 RepID=UPI0030D5B8EB